MKNFHTYEPRNYIEQNLSVESCTANLKELLEKIRKNGTN